jgi:multicomponent Na+:H+ antiporter subunit F
VYQPGASELVGRRENLVMEGNAAFYVAIALFLLLNIFAGMARIFRGPTAADRMLAVQLFGTQGVAILLLLAQSFGRPALRNVAFVFAVLAIMAMVAFVRRAPEPAPEQPSQTPTS